MQQCFQAIWPYMTASKAWLEVKKYLKLPLVKREACFFLSEVQVLDG